MDRSLRDDWPAIAACAAYHDIVNPAGALAEWRALSEKQRIAWRSAVDAVMMLADLRKDVPDVVPGV